MKKYLLVFLLGLSFAGFSQTEIAPLRNYQFDIEVSHLKTQSQVDHVNTKLQEIETIENLNFQLIDYKLTFRTTNHALVDDKIIDRVKEILNEEGIQIENLKRTEL